MQGNFLEYENKFSHLCELFLTTATANFLEKKCLKVLLKTRRRCNILKNKISQLLFTCR